jgi:hypothetical protein
MTLLRCLPVSHFNPLQSPAIYCVVQVLMQGPQLQQVLHRSAVLWSISYTQLATVLIKDAGLWLILAPRHTWPCCPLSHQQQQQGLESVHNSGTAAAAAAGGATAAAATDRGAGAQVSPEAATAAATMSTLVYCGLREPHVMQVAVVLHPGLLRLNPDTALHHVKTLQERVLQCPSWQQQLQHSLTPDQIGKALTRALTWEPRLEFLIQQVCLLY